MFLEQAKAFAKKAALFALAAVLVAALPPSLARADDAVQTAGSSQAADPEAPKDEPKISAKSAIVINADDGTVVYTKNEHERLAIASTTKIMTALLTLESAEQNDKVVTITSDMVRVEGSSMGLQVGDKLTLKGLAEGMLTVSGNDAANSAAIAVAGTLPRFADLMNQKARELNLRDTHYVTPSGLDDENHYSSAADLATLTAAALRNNDFAQIVAQQKIRVSFEDPDQSRLYTNHNKLLSMYDGCIGVKTGFTRKSGRCLVSAAEKNGVRLICVTLSDPDDWDDHMNLLNYGFTKLVSCTFDDSDWVGTMPVVGGEQDEVKIAGTSAGSVVLGTDTAAGITRSVELPRFLYASVDKGQVVGYVIYTCAGTEIARTELVATEDVARKPLVLNFWQNLINGIKRFLHIS